jgi:hypothetical protein
VTETALAPYRLAAGESFEPIPTDIVPDCGKSEEARIREEITRLDRHLKSRTTERSDRVFGKVGWVLVPLAPALSIALAYLGVLSIAGAIGSAIGGAFAALIATTVISACYEKMPEDEDARASQERLKSQRDRFTSFRSLERLTGKQARADELLGEIEAFNADLSKLAFIACTASDRRLIEERRREIIGRVQAFRQKVLPPPERTEPERLPAPTTES